MLTLRHLHDLVEEALFAHFAEDRTMATANERARVARILVHLDRHVSNCPTCSGLNVDCEYSRVGADFTNKEMNGRRAFPDLLVHRRTVQTANVLAAEVKLRESSRPRAGPDRSDWNKIEIMTGQQHGRPVGMGPYAVGLCMNLRDNSAEGWWTVPAMNLWREYEAFGLAPTPVMMSAFGTIIWEHPHGQALP